MRVFAPLCAIAVVFSLASLEACGGSVTIEGQGGSTASGAPDGGGFAAGNVSHSVSAQSGQGGHGGQGPTAPCAGAAPPGFSFNGDGTCPGTSRGVMCAWWFADTATSERGVVECEGGVWTPVPCPFVNTNFGCPRTGSELDACDALWDGITCPWAAADAGFSCNGRAQCEGGQWVSLGVDHYDEPSSSSVSSTAAD